MAIEHIHDDPGIFRDDKVRLSGTDMVAGLEQFFKRLENWKERWLESLNSQEQRLLKVHEIIVEYRGKQFEAIQKFGKHPGIGEKINSIEDSLCTRLARELQLHKLVPLKHRAAVLRRLEGDIGNALGCLRMLREAMSNKDADEAAYWAHELGVSSVMIYVRPFEPNAKAGGCCQLGGRKATDLQFGEEGVRMKRRESICNAWIRLSELMLDRDSVPPKFKDVDALVGRQFGIGPKAVSRIRLGSKIGRKKKFSKKKGRTS